VAGVPVGVLLLELVAGQGHPRRVDHDDEVTGVNVGREYRLVLAPEQHSHVAGQTAEHHVGSVNDMPLPRNVTVLRAECAHSPEPSRMYRDLPWPAPAGDGRLRRPAGNPWPGKPGPGRPLPVHRADAPRRASRAYEGTPRACPSHMTPMQHTPSHAAMPKRRRGNPFILAARRHDMVRSARFVARRIR